MSFSGHNQRAGRREFLSQLGALAAGSGLAAAPAIDITISARVSGGGGWPAGTALSDAAAHLDRHDAYPFFAALSDLLLIGPTGTNVNDLTLLLTY